MNKLKFRVWDKRESKGESTKEMLYDAQKSSLWFDFLDYPKVYELMQYTGLNDINDVPIYEGDLVELHTAANYHARNTKENHYGLYVIYWDRKYRLKQIKSNWFLNVDNDGCEYFNIMKVVGNIFENPELLK